MAIFIITHETPASSDLTNTHADEANAKPTKSHRDMTHPLTGNVGAF